MMFVTVRQVQANRENRFQVESDGRLLFQAQTPWADIRLPAQAEHLRRLTFTDNEGRELFHTEYHVLDNVLQSLTKYKALFGSSAKVAEYQVVDRSGRAQGSFYTQLDGPLTSQMTIAWGERLYDCYACALGKIYVISVYEEERQIAQITKPLDTWNRLDLFYLHLDEAYRGLLPVLSFFIIYVDARKFNRPGQITQYAVEKQWSYSYDRNNVRYNPHWIADTFGPAASEHLEYLLREHPEKDDPRVRQSRRVLKRVLWITGGVLLLAVVAVGVLIFRFLQPKTAIQPGEFAQRMEAQGYTVSDISGQYRQAGLESAYAAAGEGVTIQLLAYPSQGEAQQAFDQLERRFSQYETGGHRRFSSAASNHETYTLASEGRYYVASRIDNTLVVCTAPEADQPRVEQALEALGY